MSKYMQKTLVKNKFDVSFEVLKSFQTFVAQKRYKFCFSNLLENTRQTNALIYGKLFTPRALKEATIMDKCHQE